MKSLRKTTKTSFNSFSEYHLFLLTRILIDQSSDSKALLSEIQARIHAEVLASNIDDKISSDAKSFLEKINTFYGNT